MRGGRRLALLLALAVPGLLEGQARRVTQEGVPRQQRAAMDTTAQKKLIEWAESDSLMDALMRRKGYSVVRYQATRVAFTVGSRTIRMTGDSAARAGVERASTLLVSDTISYNDSTKSVAARGDTITLRDPSRGEDITAFVRMTYDTENKSGLAQDLRTVANSGEDWRVEAHIAAFKNDTTASGKNASTVYGRDGLITSCLDSVPHFHFLAKELKRVTGSVIVARPAIFYIQGVPVLWLPFIFQDIRDGRRSGILTPRLGFSELVRNSPTYRRTAENLGYYFAISDYLDAQLSLDWRSSARATAPDPGWLRLNGELRYRWLDRFVGGTIALSQNTLSSGTSNTAVSWTHTQEFSSKTRISSNLNYVTSTAVQRQTIINPIAAVATIASQLNLVREQGPFSINLGGSRRQYPGREQVDEDYPSLNVASKPLTMGKWFVLNPSLAVSSQGSRNLDANGDFAYRYRVSESGGLDSARLSRSTRSSRVDLRTPFKVFDFQVQAGFRLTENENDFPEVRRIIDPRDTTKATTRVYQKTYLAAADFELSVGLPQFFQGSWNLSPNVSISNVDPTGYWVRSERTGREWVSQTKRLSYGLGVSPTVFRIVRGVGPVERFRHSLSPTLSWSYSPEAKVSDEFLAALGKTSSGYLGSLTQNRVSFGLATNIEAKLRAEGDSASAEGKKVRLVSLQFTPLAYDFERKRQTGKTGFATERFGYTFRSDLLPGFDLGMDYSLFEGSVLSDTARFAPYRESVRATFSLGGKSPLLRGIGRLFGLKGQGDRLGQDTASTTGSDAAGGLVSGASGISGMGAITGTRSRGAFAEIPSGQGFQSSFTFSSQRQRPPGGNGRVIDFDPSIQCEPLRQLNPIQYDVCVRNALNSVPQDLGQNPTTAGGSFYRVPPTTSVGIRTSFNVTPKWSASWSTTYDAERKEFASQVVTLQRELHDWRALFGFTQAPNGNFAFTFFISLKAQPEVKLDYDRQTYRGRAGSLQTP